MTRQRLAQLGLVQILAFAMIAWSWTTGTVHAVSFLLLQALHSDQLSAGSKLRARLQLRTLSAASGEVVMEELVSLCKRRGFVFPSSEVYNPLAGFYDFGPLGVELKNNIKRAWWRDMVQRREDIVGLDSTIVSPSQVWQASGHIAGFSDPMVDCKGSKQRFRADQVFWAALETSAGEKLAYISLVDSSDISALASKEAAKKLKALGRKESLKPLDLKPLTEAPEDIYDKIPSPITGVEGHLTRPREFNLMFKTNVGAVTDASSEAYLRPETAQVREDGMDEMPMNRKRLRVSSLQSPLRCS